MKFIIFALALSSQISVAEVLRYEWRAAENADGHFISQCREIRKSTFTQKIEDDYAPAEKCQNLKPKTKLALIKEFTTTDCFEVDAETEGKKFKYMKRLKDCDLIKPKTEHIWEMREGGESYCMEVDVETKGKKFYSTYSQDGCRAKKPLTRTSLIVSEFNTECVEVDIATNGKKFKKTNPDGCVDLMPKTIAIIRSFRGKKTCFVVDEETQGKRYISRCLPLDPNPIVKEKIKLANEQNEPPSIFQGLMKKIIPSFMDSPVEKDSKGISK